LAGGGAFSGVWLRGGQDAAWDSYSYDPFVRTATGRRREMGNQVTGDVDPDDRKVAVIEFEHIWTTMARRGCLPVGVRIRAEATGNHGAF